MHEHTPKAMDCVEKKLKACRYLSEKRRLPFSLTFDATDSCRPRGECVGLNIMCSFCVRNCWGDCLARRAQ